MSNSIRIKRHLMASLLASLFMAATSASAADWPVFRSTPSNAGASAETINIPLVERWHSTAPDVEENGVVVANGIAYMLSEQGNLYAFNVATGFAVAGFPVSTSATYGTPAVDAANGKVYVLSGNLLRAYPLTGVAPAWTKSVGTLGANYSQGPVIDGGFVYLCAGGNLQKYDAAGSLQWLSAGAGFDQPAVMGDYVYLNTGAGTIRKYDKASGAQVTSGGFPITTAGSQAASLAAVNGKLFFKSDVLRVFDADNGGLLWSAAAGGNATYGLSPAVANGAVYVYGWDARVYAFNEATGATLTGFPSVVLNPTGDRNWGSAVVAGDKVFVGAGTSQKLKVLGAAGSAQAGQVLAEYLTFSTDTQGFDLCSPAVSDGYVFAMLDGGGLYAFYGGGGTPPSGALAINGGDNCTNSRDVTLTIAHEGDTTGLQMRISEDPYFTGAAWVAYQSPTGFQLSAGYGAKTVYAQLKSANGLLSNVFTDQITYQQDACFKPPCDVDGDGDIDKIDLSLISKARGQTPTANDPRDANGDGRIDPLDVKVCIPKCTRANCAIQ